MGKAKRALNGSARLFFGAVRQGWPVCRWNSRNAQESGFHQRNCVTGRSRPKYRIPPIAKLTINGEQKSFDDPSDMPLLWVLRGILGLTGTRFGCGIAQCGACRVRIDAKPVRPCMLPVGAVRDRAVTTIEGVGATPVGAKVQKAWLDLEVIQCGYCQSGQIMSAAALLATTPNPDAKPGERFRRPSPKAVVLPLHHSKTDYQINSISYGIVRQSSASATLDDRRSLRGDPLLASDRSWQVRLRGGFRAALGSARPDFPAPAISRSAAGRTIRR